MNIVDWIVLLTGIIAGSFFVLVEWQGELNPKLLRAFALVTVVGSALVLGFRLGTGL